MRRKEAPVGAGALALANDMALKKKKDVEWKRRLILIKGTHICFIFNEPSES
jgi:hypothetical protein